MAHDNFSIFGIPRFEIINIKDDNFFFSNDFNKGSMGTTLLISDLLDSLSADRIPATIYLYGMGVISNERSENFNSPPNRPDLIICSGAIRPKVLIDVKFHEYDTDEEPELFIRRLTKGYYKIVLCNVENFDLYLSEAKKVRCPLFLVVLFRLNRGAGFHTHIYLGLELSESLKSQLIVKRMGSPERDVYMYDYNKMLKDDALFTRIKSHLT